MSSSLLLALGLSAFAAASPLHATRTDPCAALSNTTWVKPSEVHSCLSYFPFNVTLRDNIVDVLSKTFDQFHASTKYHLNMPEPYKDITVDILGELQRIKQSAYSSDFELHQDVSMTVNRLADGHAVYLNLCYDSLFVAYLPFPLAVLAQPGDEDVQNIYIVPEASEIVMNQFGNGALKLWHSALGRNLTDFDGARIVSIDGKDPWDVVDAYAATAGGYQSKTIRQNGFFSSYELQGYLMGDFARVTLPIRGDSISLTLVRNGTTTEETYKVPYLSRKEGGSGNFTNANELWENNCRATETTNGQSLFEPAAQAKAKNTAGAVLTSPSDPYSRPARFQKDPIKPQVYRGRRLAISSLINNGPQFDAILPSRLIPTGNVSGTGGMNWFVLEDRKTAVLRLSSISGEFVDLQQNVLDGINAVKSKGASRLLIDVTNNGGGLICIALWLRRVLAGPVPGIDLQLGLDGSTRARELPKKIVHAIVSNKTGLSAEDYSGLSYTPSEYKDNNNKTFPLDYDWLNPGVEVQVNGVVDTFSQRVNDDCPFDLDPPATQPFQFENMAIISNGRCGSSCALFSILMHTKHNVKTVVMGGKPGTTQQYCGIVGGEALKLVDMDTQIKTFGLKNDSFAPPDFLTNSLQGITWRLAYSASDPSTFEEFKPHPAQYTFPLLPNTVNNPRALWDDVSRRLWLE